MIPTTWQTDGAAFSSVRYTGLYNGIDMRVDDAGGELQYELFVAPGADVAAAMIHADGGVVKVDADGSLTIQTPGGTLHETAPVSWDVLPDGTQRPLESHFRVDGQGDYGFEVVGHDPTLPLVIDPILVPAPTIVGPANGASVTEPFNISWTSVTSNPSGVIAYNWQVSTSSTMTPDRLPALGQQPDHPGRGQRPGERHLFLARPGGRRRARSGGVVRDAELHDHGRERQLAGHARARADPGLHHVPPARDRVHLVDPRPGRRDVRLGDLARGPELRVEQRVPAGQPRPDGVHLRHAASRAPSTRASTP